MEILLETCKTLITWGGGGYVQNREGNLTVIKKKTTKKSLITPHWIQSETVLKTMAGA